MNERPDPTKADEAIEPLEAAVSEVADILYKMNTALGAITNPEITLDDARLEEDLLKQLELDYNYAVKVLRAMDVKSVTVERRYINQAVEYQTDLLEGIYLELKRANGDS